MTKKAIKTELLLLDRGGERGGRRKGFGRREGGREGGEELEIGTDEKRNFKTAAYIILLIKMLSYWRAVSGVFVCVPNMWVHSCPFARVCVCIIPCP